MLQNNTTDSEIKDITLKIIDTIRSIDDMLDSYHEILLCYIMYKCASYKEQAKSKITLKDFTVNNKLKINEEILYGIKDFLNKDYWNALEKLSESYTSNQLEITILNYEKYVRNNFYTISNDTPYSVIELCKKILNINSKDEVADFCSGSGCFLNSAYMDQKKATYYGYDLNVYSKIIFLIKSEFLNTKINFELKDIFMLADKKSPKFDKIFCDHPFKGILNQNKYINLLNSKLMEKFPNNFNSRMTDWIYSALICEKLKSNGKAVSFMISMDTQTKTNQNTRQYFIENGLIESVIHFPIGIFPYSLIPISMIVFSHNNKGVRIVDATNLYEKIAGRSREFSITNINDIMLALKNETEYSKFVTNEELAKNDYSLSLCWYKDNIQFKNSIPFGSVISNITRGIAISQKEFSDEETPQQCLMITNIEDGIIDYNSLRYLKEINSKNEKYCIKDGSLIVSRIGYPTKFAVASVKKGHKILAHGNIYSLELDKSKVNPYYIIAFFMSNKGKAILKKISSRSIIPAISIDELKKVHIPLPSLDEQNEKSKKFLALMDEIQILKMRTSNAIEKMQLIFDEE